MLKVEHLTYTVTDQGKEREIVKDVSFTVKDGELLVITGPNGGGKSTVARLLMGLEQAVAGRILLDGLDITLKTTDQRARAGMGFAFQQPPLMKGMTAEQLFCIAAGRRLSDRTCAGLLENVGLPANAYRKRELDGTLSGGERKRIEIATVLARKHRICIFDEPEAGIDLWSFQLLVEQFEKLHKKKKSCLILISHQERIINMADKILVIRDGQAESFGGKDQVRRQLFGGETISVCQQQKGGHTYES